MLFTSCWCWLLALLPAAAAAGLSELNNSFGKLTHVRNLTADPVVFDDGPLIKLNVSWLPPIDHNKLTSYSITVTSISNSTRPDGSEVGQFCGDGSLFYMSQDANKTHVLLPESSVFDDALPELEIQPGCSYRVQAVANPRSGGFRKSPSIVVSVPECMAGRCNCNPAINGMPVPTVNTQTFQNGSVLISWTIDKTTNELIPVRSYRVSIGEPHLKSSSGLTVYNKTVIVELPANETIFFWRPELYKKGAKVFVETQDEYGCFGKEGSAPIRKPAMHSFYHKYMTMRIMPVIVIAGLCIAVAGLWLFIKCFKQYRNYKFMSFDQKAPSQITTVFKNPTLEALLKHQNLLYMQQEYEDATCKGTEDEHEIAYERLRIVRELGHGQFGKVYLADLRGADPDSGPDFVAVKMSLTSLDAAREQLELRQELLEEIAIMKLAGSHPHLVSLVGCCTLAGRPVCLVLEYMSGGDLLGYLHRARDAAAAEIRNYVTSDLDSPKSATTMSTNLSGYSPTLPPSRVFFPNPIKPEDLSFNEEPISHAEMMRFALEIAKGMEHLEAKGIVHRDLAARNILMDDKLRLKISDFGLSRKGTYMLGKSGVRRLPIRWMPPEAIRRRAFTSKSDVWSYGMVLWEIASLGDFPYSRLADDELLRHLLDEDGRPEGLGRAELREAQEMCWAREPELRPNFCQIVGWLESCRDAISKNNPMYQELLWENDEE